MINSCLTAHPVSAFFFRAWCKVGRLKPLFRRSMVLCRHGKVKKQKAKKKKKVFTKRTKASGRQSHFLLGSEEDASVA